MRACRILRRLLPVVMLVLAGRAAAQPAAAPGYPWYEVDAKKNVQVCLYVFWSKTCPHCPPAVAFASDLQQRRPWAKVLLFELSETPGNRQLYATMAATLGKPVGPTPAFVYCKHLHNGYLSYEMTGKYIEADLLRWYEALRKPPPPKKAEPTPKAPAVGPLTVVALVPPDPPEPPDLPPDLPPAGEALNVPVWGEVGPEELSLPAFTVVIAACDSVNPCAFFVLLLLLSILVHGHSRARMLFVGGLFVVVSGLMYFLFMAAWLNLFFLIGHLRAITLAAGGLALVAAALNIKDYFWFKQGPSLSIPDSARPGLVRRMNRLIATSRPWGLASGTAALAVAANTYELLCTSGFPMVYTRVLTLRELPPVTYYLYLAAYNVIYVLPLGLIVGAFSLTLGAHKLTEAQGRVLKLLSGMMMLALGGVLLVQPEWLTRLSSSVVLLLAAVAATAVVVAADRFARPRPAGRPRREQPAPPAAGGPRDGASFGAPATDSGRGFVH